MTETLNDIIMEVTCEVYYNHWQYIDYLIKMIQSDGYESLHLEYLVCDFVFGYI